MNLKLKRALYIFGPLAVGIGVILWVNRKRKPTPKEKAEEQTADNTTATLVAAPPPPAEFPIQQGSRGEKVREVQRALGVSADGVFGPKTEAALVAKMGVRSIRDQKQLDELKKLASGISSLSRANDLIAKYNQGASMFTVSTAQAERINIDAYGAIVYSGQLLSLPGNKLYNRDDYKLLMATKNGKLIFEITRCALMGKYLVDPNLITVK
jgi:hypothetical protein